MDKLIYELNYEISWVQLLILNQVLNRINIANYKGGDDMDMIQGDGVYLV